MIDILNFIFQDFWHWLGFFLLLEIPAEVIIKCVKYYFKYKSESEVSNEI